MDVGILSIGLLMSAGTVVMSTYLVACAIRDSKELNGRREPGTTRRGRWNQWANDGEEEVWTPDVDPWTPEEETGWEPEREDGWSPDGSSSSGGGLPVT